MDVQIPKTIFLFGHRQGHGKDTCCDILEKHLQEKDISYTRTSFARKLKQHAAERYGLDASKMDSQEYKDWCPPWIEPKTKTFHKSGFIQELGADVYESIKKGNTVNYNGKVCTVSPCIMGFEFITLTIPRSVRDVLIEEGCKGREIWEDTWCWAAYSEIFDSGAEVGFISDFRFPNEYDSHERLFDLYCERNNIQADSRPNFVKVQVYRKNGVFKNDGADAEIPDDFDYWDYNIVNDEVENWYNVLEEEVSKVFEKYHGGQQCLGMSSR